MSIETKTEFVGPFPGEWRICLDGYRVPKLSVTPSVREPDGDAWFVLLDNRFEVGPVPREEAERWIWLIANAMAIGAGLSCFGENGQPSNPYRVRMMGIEMPKQKPDLRLVTDTQEEQK